MIGPGSVVDGVAAPQDEEARKGQEGVSVASRGPAGHRAAPRTRCPAFVAAALLAVSGCAAVPGEGAATGPEGQSSDLGGRVTNVVDGDTIDVAGAGRVRVIGIDTPERGACGYESATLAMAALVDGREVTLVPGAVDDADRYGRLLRYVDVGDVDAGLSLIEDGWAIARYDSRDGYGRHPREDEYVAADLASPDRGCYPDDEP
jgi:micrococcal nuclease